MKKLRENLRIQLRGLRLNQEINGKRYTPFNILAFYLPVLANYVTIHFSGSVITALTEGRSFWDCFRYVLLSAGLVFAIYLVRRLIMRATMDMNWSSWYRREMYMTRKALSLDFAQAENPEISAMLGKAENNSQMYNGLAHQPILIRSAAVNLLSIVTAIGMSSGMLSARGDTTQGGVLQWVNSPLFAALFVLFVLLLLVLSVWGNDAQSKRAFRAHQLFGKMHMVRRYYERRVLNESGSGEDIRIFRERPLIAQELENGIACVSRRAAAINLRADSTFGMIASVVTAIIGGAVYLFVGLKALSGAFGAGKVVEYYGVMTAMITAFSDLAWTLGLLRSNRRFLEEDMAFFDLRGEMQSGSRTLKEIDPDTAEFTFHDVSFRYPGSETYALRHLNLTLRRGEKLAVVGRNGSGKTTMIKLLCRLYDPTEGIVTVNGIDVREFNYSEYLRLFGVVFQDFTLLSFTVAENVAAGEAYDEEKVMRCLDMAGVGERVRRMPKGVRQCVTKLYEEDGEDLSGGESQKIAIARALYKDAPFVILDEPTAALDPKSEAEIYARFDEISGGRTAVYVSHRMSSCRFCERIVVFADGKVVEDGTHESLLAANGAYAQLWNAQAQYYTE